MRPFRFEWGADLTSGEAFGRAGTHVIENALLDACLVPARDGKRQLRDVGRRVLVGSVPCAIATHDESFAHVAPPIKPVSVTNSLAQQVFGRVVTCPTTTTISVQ